MLSETQLQENWKEIKNGIRNLWGDLTDSELEKIKYSLDEVTGLVEEKHRETKTEIKLKLKKLLDSFDNDTDKNIVTDQTSFQRHPLGTRH